MPSCTSCGLSGGRHFDNCPDATRPIMPEPNPDAPICGPERLGDRLDGFAIWLAERSRDSFSAV